MKIQFGIGRRCINPQVPISLAGYFNKRMWDHVLDDLEVQTVVFKDGDNYSALVHFDLITVNHKIYVEVHNAIAKAGLTQFHEGNVLVTATHTHTGPKIYDEPTTPEYNLFAAAQAVAALTEAVNNIQDGELFRGMASDVRFIFNRRYWMKGGHVVTNPGKLNPDIVRPEGEIDPEIPMLAVKTADGIKLLISSIVNHTDTIGGCGVSADWPGFYRRALEPKLAPGAMVVSLIGASGNINHFDVSTDMDQTCYAEPERIGKGYAESVLAALDSLTPVTGSGIVVKSKKITTGPRKIDETEVAEAQAIVDKYPDIKVDNVEAAEDLTSEDLAKETPFALKYFANYLLGLANNTVDPEFLLTGFMFGDSTVLASLPSEPFVEIGLQVRKGVFKGKHCLIASHGNYGGGAAYRGDYIPNPWNYGRGGYEDTPHSAGYSTDTAEKLIEAWIELAK